ncbi:MAG: hypothetical protein J0H01_31845 [Rhizobiales bacterium]|nr:hypothetical protein [Hyphomicrobiales bacterium]
MAMYEPGDSGCPICGFQEYVELFAEGSPTYDICPSCGFESGVDCRGWATEKRDAFLRQRWLDDGARWWNTARPPPHGWNGIEQLHSAGLTGPHDADEDNNG